MKSCLIGDDSRVIRKVIREVLTAAGFACEEAENGQQALEACNRQLPEPPFLLDCLTCLYMNGCSKICARASACCGWSKVDRVFSPRAISKQHVHPYPRSA